MAQVYDALEGDVLQYLRKSEITINSYLPKKTREEIVLLSLTDPSELSVEELLYSATLEENKSNLIDIYNKVIELHNDWRAYNNIACIYLLEMDKENAIDYLNQAIENGGANDPDVLNNLGIVASWDGDLIKAEEFFNQENASNHNKAILSIRKGDYRSASRYYRGKNTYNATLVNILNGNNNTTCLEKTAACYYLNAIAGARGGNETILFTNLEKAINSNFDYKTQAIKDLEFLNYRENEKFISLTK